jgi:hypothetical protein
MSAVLREYIESQPVESQPAGAVVGTLLRVDANGRALVEFPGSQGEVLARCAVAEQAIPSSQELPGAAVLLVFEAEDRRRPIIAGFVRDRLLSSVTPAAAPEASASEQRIRAAKIVLEGEQELVLSCGQGTLTMTADGRIVIKGTRVTSRASETNKVRGAVVLIN